MSDQVKRISRREFMKVGGQAASGLMVACTGCVTGRRAATLASSAIRLERQSTSSEIWQITTGQFSQSNIYCELPYCSADGRHFVYERHNRNLPGKNKTELMVVEIGTWKQHRLDVTSGLTGCAISAGGIFYYLKRTEGETLDLMRADLSAAAPERIYHTKDERNLTSLGTVSPDGRYYV